MQCKKINLRYENYFSIRLHPWLSMPLFIGIGFNVAFTRLLNATFPRHRLQCSVHPGYERHFQPELTPKCPSFRLRNTIPTKSNSKMSFIPLIRYFSYSNNVQKHFIHPMMHSSLSSSTQKVLHQPITYQKNSIKKAAAIFQWEQPKTKKGG